VSNDTMNSIAVNKRFLLIGFLALLAGTMVYLQDRPIGSARFLSGCESIHLFFHGLLFSFGQLGLYAPSFFHPLAFSLISAAFLLTTKSRLVMCVAWFLINFLFELGQTLGSQSKDCVGQLPETIFIIKWLSDLCNSGVFDLSDMLAVSLGSLTAVLIIVVNSKQKHN